MRSLLFVPADSGPKLDKAMASGADAVIIDLEDSITPERKAHARAACLEYLKSHIGQKRPPSPAGAHQRPRHRHDRCRSRRHRRRASRTSSCFRKPKAAPAWSHLDAKLTAQEAIAGVPEGAIKVLAQNVESALGLFLAGTFRDSQQAADRHDLGAGGSVGRTRRARQPRRHGQLTEPYRLARSICLFGAAAARVPAIETVYVDFRNSEGLRRDTADSRRDGFTGRLAIHPAQVPVINEVYTPSRRGDRKSQGGDRRFRRAARRRRGRHRRQDVRPAASGAGAEAAGECRAELTLRPPPALHWPRSYRRCGNPNRRRASSRACRARY